MSEQRDTQREQDRPYFSGFQSVLLAAFVLLSAGISVWGVFAVPDGARIPIQWGSDGVTNTLNKPLGLVVVPALQLVLTLVAVAIPRIAPRQRNLRLSRRAYRTIWLAVLGFLTLTHGLSLADASGVELPTMRVVFAAVSVLFVVIGNVLSTVQSNFFLGVRTPWTLTSDYTWRKTHRLAGPLFVILGILTFVLSLVAEPSLAGTVLGIGAAGFAVLAVVYSYLVWRRAPDRNPNREHDAAE
jgi:uncharacterized membrane protein